ncbi:zinc transporter ZIP1-like [Microcaecilia unicolor]|uniref:Zinc transporter ZIP1-like n=1 Tax=Microcaecilia unicolor TaxID=1415580 RepID=A0A6P7WVZ7_9AMPH|nr:zinc transporter ZIP1-like [Microcaecilia unicolor]
MDPLLAVKVGCLVGLMILTIVCGLIPAHVKWFQNRSSKGMRTPAQSMIASFGAGIFLGAGLMHILADYLRDIDVELRNRLGKVGYPMAELILSLGFLLVLIIEQVVIQFFHQQVPEQNGVNIVVTPGAAHLETKQDLSRKTEPLEDPSDPHVHLNFEVHVSFRSLILFCSLSIHSAFSGLSIGLQTNYSSTIQICIAVMIHKVIIIFSLSLKLVNSRIRPQWLLAYISIFSLITPVGIGVGILISMKRAAEFALIQAILEGIAAGIFLYVTCLEILTQELNAPGKPLLKTLFIVLGFSVMALIAIWT